MARDTGRLFEATLEEKPEGTAFVHLASSEEQMILADRIYHRTAAIYIKKISIYMCIFLQ